MTQISKAYAASRTTLHSFRAFHTSTSTNMKHHLMIGTWTPPGAIFTVAFDDEKHTLELVKRTEIPRDEAISWMTFDVRDCNKQIGFLRLMLCVVYEEEHLWGLNEEMVQPQRQVSDRDHPSLLSPNGRTS